MNCPNKHKEPLEKMLFHEVEVDYCPTCLGIWFDKDELTMAKNDTDNQLNWMDFDIWRDKKKFHVFKVDKYCPACRVPFYEVSYDGSRIKVDFCRRCQGIWLDRGEFKQIIIYLIRKYDYEILHHYTKNLLKQLWEVFAGPEKLRDELEDFFMVTKLFNYKFVIQHPWLNYLIDTAQK